MKIIPAIYLSAGRCVSRYKSQIEHTTLFRQDPLQIAKSFEKHGAKMIHLVDSDAVDGGNAKNRKVARLIAEATELSVSYAGGISSLDEISELFLYGIHMVCLNQFSESLLVAALAKFGADKIAFTIQSQKHVVPGKSGVEVFDYARHIADRGVTNIICRDLKAEGSFHPNFDEVERVKFAAPKAKIYAFGGIGSISDLEILERAGAYAAIISRAFLERKISLEECVERFGD